MTVMSALAGSVECPRILLVEDNFIIAEGLRMVFENAGMDVVGPAHSLPQALELLKGCPALHAAIIDLNLNGEPSLPILDLLIASAVPVLLMTGHDVAVLPGRYRSLPNFEKPASPVAIIEKVRSLISMSESMPNGESEPCRPQNVLRPETPGKRPD
jgi:DNA-binding response OmpR family regulator